MMTDISIYIYISIYAVTLSKLSLLLKILMMSETEKKCGACQQDMLRSAFSKKQWERKKFRRCKACVDHEVPFQRPSKNDYLTSNSSNNDGAEDPEAAASPTDNSNNDKNKNESNTAPPEISTPSSSASEDLVMPVSAPQGNTTITTITTIDSEEEEENQKGIFTVSTEEMLDYKVEPIVNVEQEINDLLHPNASMKNDEPEPSGATNIVQQEDDDHSQSTEDDHSQATEPIKNTSRENNATILAADSIESDAQHWDPTAMMHLDPVSARPPEPMFPPPAVPTTEGDNEEDGIGNDSLQPYYWFQLWSSRTLAVACLLSVLGLVLSSLASPENQVLMLIFAAFSMVLAVIMLLKQLYGQTSSDDEEPEDVVEEPEDPLTEPLLPPSGGTVNHDDEIV
jgi:hypothetical protein